jgi:DNA-binding transcriptional MerR regulator
MIDIKLTIGELARYTGASRRQLDYWTTSGLLKPSGQEVRKGWRTYTFDDLIRARAVATLRKEGVSLRTIRKVEEHLSRYSGDPLRELKLVVHGGEVFVYRSREEAFHALTGQATFLFMDLHQVAREAEDLLAAA